MCSAILILYYNCVLYSSITLITVTSGIKIILFCFITKMIEEDTFIAICSVFIFEENKTIYYVNNAYIYVKLA